MFRNLTVKGNFFYACSLRLDFHRARSFDLSLVSPSSSHTLTRSFRVRLFRTFGVWLLESRPLALPLRLQGVSGVWAGIDAVVVVLDDSAV